LLCLAVSAVVVAGCVQVNVPKDVNVNLNGKGESRSDAENDRSSQLPAGSSRSGSWQELLLGVGQHIIGGEKGFLYYAFDSLAYPGEPVSLVARCQDLKGLAGVRGLEIGFYRGGRRVGGATTDEDGTARLSWTPPDQGIYRFEARVDAAPDEREPAERLSAAPLRVLAAPADTPLAVIDLDHTVVDSSFWRVLLLGSGEPMAGSVRVSERIAAEYGNVYLTHRPDLLTRKSKDFLDRNGYPPGPLLVSEIEDVLDSGAFKSGKLRDLRKYFPEVRIGIGDKISDAQAYVDNGLTAYLLPYYEREVEAMRETADAIDRIDGPGTLQVVQDWGEIERGIFQGKRYRPADFTRWLRREADRLERRKRRQERDDDDDDDDDDDEEEDD
jgi:hypothetical protein